MITCNERDAETGLDYFGARYFSGAMGRFTSPDKPLADQDPSDPQSWNLYSYVRNNPLVNIDPNGEDCVYTSNQTDKSITVAVEQGSCSQKGGTFINGTVDMGALTYTGKSLDIGYTDPNGAAGVFSKSFVGPTVEFPGIEGAANRAGASRIGASNGLIAGFAAADVVFAASLGATYAGPALYAALAAGGEAGVLRFGSKAFELVRDASGRVHGDLPKYIPKNVTRERLELAAQELKASIQARQQNMVQLGEQGNHGLRLAQEQRLLYQIQQRLGQR